MYRCVYCLSLVREESLGYRIPGHIQTVVTRHYSSEPVQVSTGSYRASLVAPDCPGGWFDECYVYTIDDTRRSVPDLVYFWSTGLMGAEHEAV